MANKYEFLGKAFTVGQLVELLRENVVNEDTPLYLTGVECNVIAECNTNGDITSVILDDDDYSEQWNEEAREV